jgi:putative Mn2+ efflux pump MntP
MNLFTIFAIALGLAMDAFAVSITCGFIILPPKKPKAIRIASSFGGFQAVMPLIGWEIGRYFHRILEQVDHWVAFILLAIIGCHMIYEATKTEQACPADPSNGLILISLSIATSIDAFAVGVLLALLKVQIITPILIIGFVTFFISLLGLLIGHKIGAFFGRKLEIGGGLILIAIGLKILLEGLGF